MREMKDSGIEWCKSIPTDWRVLRIKYIMYERREKTRTGEEEPLSVTQKYGIVKTKDIEVANPSVSYDDYIIVSRNDIVFNKYKAHSGVFFVTPYDGIVTFNYSVYRCYNGFNPKYYEYLFHTQGCIGEFKTRLHGVGESISPLYTKDLYSVTVFAPTFEEQNRIVTYLDSICAEINTTISDIEREIEALEEYKRSVITEAVTKGLNPDAEMRDSGVQWIGEIPYSWQTIKGKYMFIQRNQRGNNIKLQLLSPTQRYGVIPQDLYEELSGYKAVKLDEKTDFSLLKTIHKGDYCISLRSFQGGFEYSEYEGVVSPAYQVFYAVANIYDGYYKHLFKTQIFIDKMNSFTMSLRDGKNIAFSDFGNTYIPVPTLEEQQQIADYLDKKCSEIDSIISEKKQQIETIEEYKKSLIFEYVTGKKEVV